MEGRHIDGTVMVGQYTQTRQRKLRVKTVKSGYSRHYKRRILPRTEKQHERNLEKEIENLKRNRKGKHSEKKEGNSES